MPSAIANKEKGSGRMTPILGQMKAKEEEAADVNQGWWRVGLLFSAAEVGILASWFVSIAVVFLGLPPVEQTLVKLFETANVSLLGFVIQVALSTLIVVLIFPLIYVRVGLNTTDAPGLWLFLAFQNGFFSDALVGDLVSQFESEAGGSEQGIASLLVGVGPFLA
jgi:hypothetical protein